MLHGLIDIPTIYYFEEKNIWTGSLFREFNYRIIPVKTEEKQELICKIWYGMLCYDLVEDFEAELSEEMTADGLNKIIDFVNAEAIKFRDNH